MDIPAVLPEPEDVEGLEPGAAEHFIELAEENMQYAEQLREEGKFSEALDILFSVERLSGGLSLKAESQELFQRFGALNSTAQEMVGEIQRSGEFREMRNKGLK